jgi:hypothetical protein
MNMRIRPALLCQAVVLVLASFSPPLLAREKANPAPPEPILVRRENDFPYWFVPVEIAGRSYPFLVDTGSAFDVFADEIPVDVGPAIGTAEIKTAGAVIQQPIFAAPKANISGKAPLATDPILKKSLAGVSKLVGFPVGGILGMGTIGKYAWSLDPIKNELRIAMRADQFSKKGYEQAKIIPFGGSPSLIIVFGDDASTIAKIDSGFIGLLTLNRTDAGSLLSRKIAQSTTLVFPVEGFAGKANQPTVNLSALKLFKANLKNVSCSLSEDYSLLGMEFMRRFSVIWDFQAGIFYYRSNEELSAPQVDRPWGLTVRTDGQQVYVDGLNQAGIFNVRDLREDDKILTVDSNKPTSPWDFYRKLAGSKRPTLVIEREGHPLKVKLVPNPS